MITEYYPNGEAKEKKMALIHNSAQIGYDGSVLDNNQPVYLAQKFSPEEIRQINEAKAISQSSASSSSRYYYQKKADDKLTNIPNQDKKSVILVDQIRTLDRDKFLGKISEVDNGLMDEVERKIHFVLALKN